VTPIVFLHGFTGVPENFEPISATLEVPKTILAPALLGHRGGPSRGESFVEEVQRLASWLDREATAPAIVVGYSLGARLALALAQERPAAFRAMILISVNPGLRLEADRAARIASDEELAGYLERQGTAAFLAQHWERQPLFASQQNLPSAVLATQQMQRMRHDPYGLANCLRVLGLGAMPSYWDFLPQLADQVPITLLTGTLDEKFQSLASEICTTSRKIAWLSAPNVGHNLLLEAPELVARLVQHSTLTR
jgi:2-succinyl-6-hydroxy-2,4-cyclohexadiene-1-carboxylate synthase